MAGIPTAYRSGTALNVTRLAGLLFTIIGAVGSRGERDPDLLTISRGDSEVWRGIPNAIVIHEQHDVSRQRLVIKDSRLVGALLVGDQSLSATVHRLIRDQIDIGSVLPALQASQVNLATVLGRFAVEEERAGLVR